MMGTQTTSRWYRKQEMLTKAERYGYTASEELIDDWIDKGLLGEAGNRDWPGRGSRAWWPQEQLDLFLRLLAHRQGTQNKIHIGPLCGLPVFAWLYLGELGGVSLHQVKKAMKTWMDYQCKVPEEQIRKSVTQLVKSYQGPRATNKRALIDAVMEIGTGAKTIDPEVLQFLLDPIVNAYPKKATKGPVREQYNMVEILSALLPIRLQVLLGDTTILDLPENIWHWARTANLAALTEYIREQPLFASDLDLGAQFGRVTLNTLCQESCHILLMLLGTAQENECAPESSEYSFWLYPRAWQRREATSVIRTQVVYSQLVLPTRQPIRYIRNEVTISYRGTQHRFALDLSFI